MAVAQAPAEVVSFVVLTVKVNVCGPTARGRTGVMLPAGVRPGAMVAAGVTVELPDRVALAAGVGSWEGKGEALARAVGVASAAGVVPAAMVGAAVGAALAALVGTVVDAGPAG